MRILELTNYSAGGCGVWARARQEAILLAKKGHKVRVFSSYFTKGSKELALAEEMLGKVRISRFPAIKLGGESFMLWNFEDEAIEFKPDIIIAHSYRHFHTHKAIRIARKIGCKVFLVTHAPFGRSETRNILSNLAVWFYDKLIGSSLLKRFNKIISISHWEEEYLNELGVSKDKIVYIPNGLSNLYFEPRELRIRNGSFIYTGRIAAIKNLELILNAIRKINKNVEITLFGPAEKEYLRTLSKIITDSNLQNKVKIVNKSFDSKEQIAQIDKNDFFILPSKSEGMPQVLIEAMARGKVCIASDNQGNSDIIQDGKNGFLFKNNSAEDLARKINQILEIKAENLATIGKNAVSSANSFKWSIIIERLNSLLMQKTFK